MSDDRRVLEMSVFIGYMKVMMGISNLVTKLGYALLEKQTRFVDVFFVGLLTPCSSVFPEVLIVAQIFKNSRNVHKQI